MEHFGSVSSGLCFHISAPSRFWWRSVFTRLSCGLFTRWGNPQRKVIQQLWQMKSADSAVWLDPLGMHDGQTHPPSEQQRMETNIIRTSCPLWCILMTSPPQWETKTNWYRAEKENTIMGSAVVWLIVIQAFVQLRNVYKSTVKLADSVLENRISCCFKVKSWKLGTSDEPDFVSWVGLLLVCPSRSSASAPPRCIVGVL